MSWPFATCWPAATPSSETTPSRCATISFSIFIASTTQISRRLRRVPVGDLDCEHGSLHRAHDGVRRAAREPLAPLPVSPRELGPGRLGRVHANLVAASVELDGDEPLARRARSATVETACGMLPSPSSSCARCASSSDSTTPRHVSPRDEARRLEERAVEAEKRRRPVDHELVERAQHPAARSLAVDVVDDELRDQRVVEIRDLVALADARVDANADSRRARGTP